MTRRPSATALAVADRLHSSAIHLLRRVRGQDAASGLSPARLSALSVVVFAGPVTLTQLARAEQVTPPTMTRLVAALEADGFVLRDTDATDRRIVRLSATAKGRKVLQEGKRRRVHALAEALSGLPPQQLLLLSEAAELIDTVFAPATAQGTRRR